MEWNYCGFSIGMLKENVAAFGFARDKALFLKKLNKFTGFDLRKFGH